MWSNHPEEAALNADHVISDDELVELYNLKNDLRERQELSAKDPEKTRALLDMLHKWQKSVGAKMPGPNPDYAPKPGSP